MIVDSSPPRDRTKPVVTDPYRRGLSPEVLEAIDRYVEQVVADAPKPTDEQIMQLLQWFGPRPDAPAET